MSFRFCFIGGAVVIFMATFAAPASAQFVIGNGGMSVNGVDLSAYGGVSSVEVMDSGYATPGFSAGVIGPYGGSYIGPGWGGGFNPGYPMAYYGRSYGGFGYGYGGGFGGGFWGGNFVAAPLVIPAETMYGPGPVRRMMGLDPPLGTPIIQQTTVVNNPAPRPNGFGVLANPQPNNGIPGRPNVIAANPQTQQRARKIVDAGDVAFQQQKFAEAYANYKDAARAAPDLPDAYFRQAAAAIALQRYEEAAASIKFGLRLSSSWVDSKFRFSALYGPAMLARQQHLAALAQATNDRPTSDVLFVYGVALFFDDHPVWARAPLERAQALAIGETWHIELFLKAIDRMPPDAAPQPAMPDQRPVPRPVDDGVRDI